MFSPFYHFLPLLLFPILPPPPAATPNIFAGPERSLDVRFGGILRQQVDPEGVLRGTRAPQWWHIFVALCVILGLLFFTIVALYFCVSRKSRRAKVSKRLDASGTEYEEDSMDTRRISSRLPRSSFTESVGGSPPETMDVTNGADAEGLPVLEEKSWWRRLLSGLRGKKHENSESESEYVGLAEPDIERRRKESFYAPDKANDEYFFPDREGDADIYGGAPGDSMEMRAPGDRAGGVGLEEYQVGTNGRGPGQPGLQDRARSDRRSTGRLRSMDMRLRRMEGEFVGSIPGEKVEGVHGGPVDDHSTSHDTGTSFHTAPIRARQSTAGGGEANPRVKAAFPRHYDGEGRRKEEKKQNGDDYAEYKAVTETTASPKSPPRGEHQSPASPSVEDHRRRGFLALFPIKPSGLERWEHGLDSD